MSAVHDRTHDQTLSPTGDDCTESAKRRQILEGARKVFLVEGFDGASMGEIAKVAGVSKGTLYVYFDSKESLFAALTTEEKRGLAEVLLQNSISSTTRSAPMVRDTGMSLVSAGLPLTK